MRKLLLASVIALGTAFSTGAIAGPLTCNGYVAVDNNETQLAPYNAVIDRLLVEYFGGRRLTEPEAQKVARRLSIECVTKGRQNFETAVRTAMQSLSVPNTPPPVMDQRAACHEAVDAAWAKMRWQMMPSTCSQSFNCTDAHARRYDACGG